MKKISIGVAMRYVAYLIMFIAFLCFSDKSVYADEVVVLKCEMDIELERVDEGRNITIPINIEQTITINYTLKTANNWPAVITDGYIESSWLYVFRYRIDRHTGELTLLELTGSSKDAFHHATGHGKCSEMNLAKYPYYDAGSTAAAVGI